MELLKEGPLTFACKSSWQDWQAWYIFFLIFTFFDIGIIYLFAYSQLLGLLFLATRHVDENFQIVNE